MSSIRPCALPADALLLPYAGAGGYADCYVCEVDGLVSHAAFVEAFYTTSLFKLERFILRWLARRPSTDADARRLAEGAVDAFAAWSVEARADNQLLLADFSGQTRSWLMVAARDGEPVGTRLLFGSAVLPVRNKTSGETRMGFGFSALLGIHRLYSRALLSAARARLVRKGDVDRARLGAG